MTKRSPARRSRRLTVLTLVTALMAAVALVVSGCGGDDDEEHGGGHESGGGAAEQAFLSGMVPHHESAIEMATIARSRAKAPEIKQLAESIVSAQKSEISELKRIHQRLYDKPLKPDEGAHEKLGLSAEEAGMTHSEADNTMLREADPFDREFVDMMVPHHEGAAGMAKAVLKEAEDAELKALAQKIVTDQEREIREMNSFREKTYGGPVPEDGQTEEGHSG